MLAGKTAGKFIREIKSYISVAIRLWYKSGISFAHTFGALQPTYYFCTEISKIDQRMCVGRKALQWGLGKVVSYHNELNAWPALTIV